MSRSTRSGPRTAGKAGIRMTKLEQLRKAEENARLQIEKAEKEAQKVRLSIPDVKEEQKGKVLDRLNEISLREEQKIEENTSKLRDRLEKATEERLKELAGGRDRLEKSATEGLARFIAKSGEQDT